jgi:hypothetical protein
MSVMVASIAGDQLDEAGGLRVVKRLTLRSSSRNRVAIGVLLSRFFMSSLACVLIDLGLDSWLTVCSSSFMDCILEVVSSLVL